MKALYFSFLPQDEEATKSEHRERHTITGSRVYVSGVFQALLEHSTYDHIFLPTTARPPEGDLRDSPLFQQNRHRLEFVSDHQLARMRQYDRAVFMAGGMDLGTLSRWRRVSGCPRAPLSGMIHSINNAHELRAIFMLVIAPLCRHDALICSSSAGRTGIVNFVNLVRDRMLAAGFPVPSPKFRMPVIPLGADVRLFQAGRDASRLRATLELGSGPVVLYFGRLSALSKGDLLPLILAFARLQPRYAEASLVLAGDDTQCRIAPILRALAAQAAPNARVRVIPNPDLQAKQDLFALADIFASPSDSLQETFGISVVEAMAAGLPTVVSDWDGYKDLVVHGETGFRIRTALPRYPPSFDDLRGFGTMTRPDLLAATTIVDVNHFSSALAALIADPERRRAMGDAARARAAALFDWPVVIAAYESLWAELAAESAGHDDGASGPVLDVERFGYQEIFSHYPTEFLADDCRIQLSASQPASRDGYAWVAATMAAANWFDPAIFTRIIAELERRGAVRLSDLLDVLRGDADIDRTVGTTHLCRLLKYGIVEQLGVAQPEWERTPALSGQLEGPASS